MTEKIVFSSENMPRRLYKAEHTIVKKAPNYPSLHAAYEARNLLAHKIADAIASDSDFFYVEEIDHGYYLRTRVDAVVMTTDEWRTEMEAQFKRGIECGLRMNPTTWMDSK